jgi:hypothetical protein
MHSNTDKNTLQLLLKRLDFCFLSVCLVVATGLNICCACFADDAFLLRMLTRQEQQ